MGGIVSNTITGTDGDDKLIGNKLDNYFIASRGFDYIDGGLGNDTVSYADAPFTQIHYGPNPLPVEIGPFPDHGVRVDLAEGIAYKDIIDVEVTSSSVHIEITTVYDKLVSIENIVGSANNDVLLGSSVGNQLSGMDGRDTIDGRAGDDKLFGGDGNDVIIGGAGADNIDGGNSVSLVIVPTSVIPGIHYGTYTFQAGDVASYETSSKGVSVDLTLLGPQSGGDAQGDVLTGIEELRGSAFGDTLSVDGGIAYGDGGNDVLRGGSHSDKLVGGTGSDGLYGGAGDDILYAGSESNEKIVAAKGNDLLFGGAGDDLLFGGGLPTVFSGGDGNDAYFNVTVADKIIDSSGIDSVFTKAEEFHLGAGIENLVFEDESIKHEGFGNDLDNILVGSAGRDVLHALGGNDTVDGGAGNDVIYDLQKNDTVVASEGVDTVVGFDATDSKDHDVIDLHSLGYTSLQDFYDQGGSIVQIKGDTHIVFGDSGNVTVLKDVNVTDIDETDFVFK